MPTTQRLLTDETGQALVTAVNNIVAAVKPNATEIQMSSSDTTTVATAITNINNKIGTVPSGQTVESQITTLNSNMGKTNIHIDVSSQTYNSVAGATALFNALPTTFKGTCYATFTSGYNAVCLVDKQTATYGSIIYEVDWDTAPFHFVMKNGTASLDQLALNSNTIFETITSGDLNNYTASGMKVKHYCGADISSFTNIPPNLSTYSFTLDVFPVGTDTNYTKQVLHYYGTKQGQYERQQYYYGGKKWTDWEQLALNSKIPYITSLYSNDSGTKTVDLITIPLGASLLSIGSYSTSSAGALYLIMNGSNKIIIPLVTHTNYSASISNNTLSITSSILYWQYNILHTSI